MPIKKYRYFFVILIILGNSLILSAQDKIYQKGDMFFKTGNYKEALEKYSQIEDIYLKDVPLKYKIGMCYLHSNNYKHKAIDYFNFCIKYKNEQTPPISVYFYLGKALHYQYKFVAAINTFNTYLEKTAIRDPLHIEAQEMIAICENAIKIYNEPLKDIVIKPMYLPANSSYNDIAPIVANQGFLLVIASNRPRNTVTLVKDASEVLFTKNQSDTKYATYFSYARSIDWSHPEHLKINNKKNVIPLSFNLNGRQLLISISWDLDDHVFYIINSRGSNNWSNPKRLSNNINSIYKEKGACLSGAGKVIYFASNRPGGKGGYDIYRSVKRTKEWSTPENLGPSVNTIFDEINPYIHTDQRTLYFCSNGHNTMGGFDIFKSRQSNYNWTKPQNLGYPINSVFNETHYNQFLEDTNIYITSDRFGDHSFGNHDIIQVHKVNKTLPITMVNGVINVLKDKKNVPVKLQVIDKQTNEIQKYIYSPTDNSGRFFMILRNNKHYIVKILDESSNDIYEMDISIPKNTYNYQISKMIYITSIKFFDQVVGEKVDVKGGIHKVIKHSDLSVDKSIRDIRYEALVLLMERIIERADYLGLQNINSLEEEIFKPVKEKPGTDAYYTPMLDRIEDIIEDSDTASLANVGKFADRYVKTKFFRKTKDNIRSEVFSQKLKYENNISELSFEDKKHINMVIDVLKENSSLRLEIRWTNNSITQERIDENIKTALNDLTTLFNNKGLSKNQYKFLEDVSSQNSENFIGPEYYKLYSLKFEVFHIK